MHNSTEVFTCAKSKHTVWKTLLSSVRWGANVDKRKAPCWNCFLSRRKTAHIASFLFADNCFSVARIAKISLLALIVASLDNHLVLHARCNCRPFVFVVVWCIARQADRNGKTVKHIHNCMRSAFAVSYTILYKSAAVAYSKRPKRSGVHDNAQIPNLQFSLLTSATEDCVGL